MKQMLIAVLAVGLLAFSASNALAFLSVSADVPVSYSFDESGISGESVSGLKLAVNLPFFVGLGVENYSVDAKGQGLTPEDFSYDVRMYDLFLDLPFPFLNLSIGGGVGTGEFSFDDPTAKADDAKLTQVFAALGYPFAGIFDVHVGYHQISGDADIPGTSQTINTDATMWTLGLRVGF